MKRIGILTYHKSNNYGAFMQCYSLSTKLKELFPNEKIEVVDYLSKEVYSLYHPSIRNFLYLIIHTQTFRRKLSYTKMFLSYLKDLMFFKRKDVESSYFDKAQHKLTLSHEQIISDDYNRIVRFLNEKYDILIVGSDAVWNWQIRPFPNVYFLGSQIKSHKLSYAASSYGQPYMDLSDNIKHEISDGWQTFDYIGVRDLPTEQFVSKYTSGLKPIHNCDPTVFLDISKLPVDKNLILSKLKKAGFDSTKKTIGIMAQSWLAKYVREKLGNKYQIVSVFKYSEYADVNLLDIDPFEWVVCFSYFDLTITHYFHGNLLSLKNGTPTICIEQKSHYNKVYDSKIRDFMHRIDLIHQCFWFDEVCNEYDLKDLVANSIDSPELKHRISSGLESEASSFNSFIDALENVINIS